MTAKPTLSFWQIWNMCFGFLGIQFGFALQNANVSRIFQTLGASMDEALHLPVLGQVAAGVPIGADIGSDQMVLMDRACFSPTPDYLLKVKGDSMRDEGIFDGDLIGVHRTSEARNGQVVIARIDDEITVKLLKMGQGRIRLLPRNPDYAPIEVQPGQDFAIEGLYCGLVRPNA